jgi:hypothetical protein
MPLEIPCATYGMVCLFGELLLYSMVISYFLRWEGKEREREREREGERGRL